MVNTFLKFMKVNTTKRLSHFKANIKYVNFTFFGYLKHAQLPQRNKYCRDQVHINMYTYDWNHARIHWGIKGISPNTLVKKYTYTIKSTIFFIPSQTNSGSATYWNHWIN